MSMFSPALREVSISEPSSSRSTSRVVMTRRSSSTAISTGTSLSGAISSRGVIVFRLIDRPSKAKALVDQVDGFLAELVHRGDYTGVSLVAALEHNQVGELAGDIHRGGFN